MRELAWAAAAQPCCTLQVQHAAVESSAALVAWRCRDLLVELLAPQLLLTPPYSCPLLRCRTPSRSTWASSSAQTVGLHRLRLWPAKSHLRLCARGPGARRGGRGRCRRPGLFHCTPLSSLDAHSVAIQSFLLLSPGELYDQIRLRGRLDEGAARFYAAEVVLMLEHLRAHAVVGGVGLG